LKFLANLRLPPTPLHGIAFYVKLIYKDKLNEISPKCMVFAELQVRETRDLKIPSVPAFIRTQIWD
jgi:hypothetical protein